MNYQDEDEENNLYYQKFKKKKMKKPIEKTVIETTTVNLQKKRQRHDSDSSDEDDEVSDRYGDSPKNEPAHKVSITVNQLFILPNGIITGLIKKGEVFRFINFPSLTPSLKLN